MRPELPAREHELLSLYGMLFLAASITAAGLEDDALALAMHEEAQAAADRLGPEHDTHRTIFGPTNVAVHRVAALVRLHEAGRALEYAAGIDPTALATLPPERKVNYLLDLTEAYTFTGQYQQAVHSLGEAERVAPEEVRCRPLAHGLLRSLLNNTSGEPSRIVRRWPPGLESQREPGSLPGHLRGRPGCSHRRHDPVGPGGRLGRLLPGHPGLC